MALSAGESISDLLNQLKEKGGAAKDSSVKTQSRELLNAEGELDPDVEAELIALREACFASEDMKEGVRAFGEKRPARWQGR